MFTTEKARAKMGRAYPEPAAPKPPRPKSHNHCAEVLGAPGLLVWRVIEARHLFSPDLQAN